ncbi:DUF1643 domain-containing protein [Plesiomonas shigelloides]|uniref:DUF1643 domain-containing protein n=1 Tax=Plesiomonas shigelloides TaxID=703 RepID=UPI00387EF7B4
MFDIYECNEGDSVRFLLGTSGKPTLIVVGLNPSTASSEKSDTTVSKVKNVAQNAGFNGFVMTNLYPLRSTDPRKLPQYHSAELLSENIRHIEQIASNEMNPIFWAAWGSGIELRPYLKQAMIELNQMVKRINGKWIHFGDLTQRNHPRHPSRLKYAWKFKDFDITKY